MYIMRAALRVNIPVLFVFLLILGWPALSPAQSVDRIVAVVNGEIITLRQLDNRVNSLMKSQKAGNVGRDEVRQRVLDALIEQELINQAAKAKGVFVTEADISA
ncbi:SurA N-terminal domain-containing protein, partial [Deltaproteobacteria bacterium OttesenSCG-928-M10]|nr:SurA N-terminal domain-containing protein [Deltaproteobacteria bacterium OttesenSCG-928-M10]